jgi:cell division protein FtsB
MVVKQLGDDTLWPMLRSDSFQWQQKESLERRATQQQDMGLHGTDGRMVADIVEANEAALQAVVNPRTSQRKRGRPRLSFPQSEVRSGHMSQPELYSARQLHLEKNRKAAAKCRERSKQHTVELVAQASDLSSKNKALKAEETELRKQILELKNEVLRHAGCGSWAIDEYVSQCAGEILGVKAPSVQTSVLRRDSTQTQCLDGSAKRTNSFVRETVFESPTGQGSIDLSIESDEYESYESLRLFNIYGDISGGGSADSDL